MAGFRKQTERVATVTPTVAGEARESATPAISYNVMRLGAGGKSTPKPRIITQK